MTSKSPAKPVDARCSGEPGSEPGDQAGTALCLETFLVQLEDSRLFYPAAFKNSDLIRDYLGQSLFSTAADARQRYLADMAANSLSTDPQKLLGAMSMMLL